MYAKRSKCFYSFPVPILTTYLRPINAPYVIKLRIQKRIVWITLYQKIAMELKFSHDTAQIFFIDNKYGDEKILFNRKNVHFTIAYYLLKFHFVEMLLNFRNAFIVVFPGSV